MNDEYAYGSVQHPKRPKTQTDIDALTSQLNDQSMITEPALSEMVNDSLQEIYRMPIHNMMHLVTHFMNVKKSIDSNISNLAYIIENVRTWYTKLRKTAYNSFHMKVLRLVMGSSSNLLEDQYMQNATQILGMCIMATNEDCVSYIEKDLLIEVVRYVVDSPKEQIIVPALLECLFQTLQNTKINVIVKYVQM